MPSQTETSQPKLLLRKPSKAELKKFKAEGARAPPPPPPPPPPRSMDSSSKGTPAELAPKKPFLRRIFPFLLVVNFAVGAYVLLRTNQKKEDEEIPVKEEEPVPLISELTSTSTSAETSQPEALQPAPVPPPRVIPPPISESQRKELFKWMLEEKRKVKPSSAVEKKKINEEKALLKQYIRAESVPIL